MKDWLSIRELSERWHVGYDTTRRDVVAGKIPHLSVGKARRISLAWVQKREEEALSGALHNARVGDRKLKRYAGNDHFADIQ